MDVYFFSFVLHLTRQERPSTSCTQPFIWGKTQCEINNCKRIRAIHLLSMQKNTISKAFDSYDGIYDQLNILFIDDARYHSGNNKEENYFKIYPIWEYNGSLEKDGLKWSNIFNFLIHPPKISIKRYLKMLTIIVHSYSFQRLGKCGYQG